MLRFLASAALLVLAAVAVAPQAAAYTLPTYCIGYKEGMCEENDVVEVGYAGHEAGVCVIAVAGSCDPYDGHLVRADVDGQDYVVPDPCYTTMCF
jgi:hypothetical protein